jgi:tight adherence protein B
MTPLLLLGSVAAAGAAGGGSLALLDALEKRGGAVLAQQRQKMTDLGMDVSLLGPFLRIWWGLTVGAFLIVWLGAGAPLLGLLAGALIYKLMPLVLEARTRRYQNRLREQTAVAARGLAAQLRGRVTLVEGLTAVARDCPAPLGPQLKRAMAQYEQGTSLKDAMRDLRRRLKLDGITLLVIGLVVTEERGGRLSDVLDRLCGNLEEQLRVERKRATDTAAGRLMIGLLAFFPVAFLGMFYVLDPESTGLMFTTIAGQVVLMGVAALSYASVRWGQSILRNVGGMDT